MGENLLHNSDFEVDWSQERSHRCLVFPRSGEAFQTQRGNIFTPPSWTVWFLHGRPVEHDPANEVGWAQPEVRAITAQQSPRRVHSGGQAMLLFTFYRIHDAGFFQQIALQAGTRVRLSAWAHAWSSQDDDSKTSEDAPDSFYAEGGSEDLTDSLRNFTFWLGLDPGGGTDPCADSVVWGQGAHIYNRYHQVPPVEAVAQGDTVTVFLRSRTLWPFKHNDAYWDHATLEVVTGPPEVRITFEPEQPVAGQQVEVTARSEASGPDGDLRVLDPDRDAVAVSEVPVDEAGVWRWTFDPDQAGAYEVTFLYGGEARGSEVLVVQPEEEAQRGRPRELYVRTYVLLPPNTDPKWVEAVLTSRAWEASRWTVGGSADDAGIGALENKTVIAVNAEQWPADLQTFFQRYYPCTRYVAIEVATPRELQRRLDELADVL